MKRILCFGDSNTWGQIPPDRGRYSYEERWTGVMARILGEGFQVIENGICGRTSVWEDPLLPSRNGLAGLGEALLSQGPLTLLILSLGTNDLKYGSPVQAAEGVRRLVELARNADNLLKPVGSIFPQGCRILILSPVLLHREIARLSPDSSLSGQYDSSVKLTACLRQTAEETGSSFMDAGGFAKASDEDGIHMDGQDHLRLGYAVADKVRHILCAE